MLNRTDDFLAPSAQVNSRFINSAIFSPHTFPESIWITGRPVRPPECENKSTVPFKDQRNCCRSATIPARWPPLFSEKIPEPRQLDDVVRRQDRADKIRLRRGVNFVQMTLRFGLTHKLLDALVQGATFADHIGTRAE
jgi:hypothetical protein